MRFLTINIDFAEKTFFKVVVGSAVVIRIISQVEVHPPVVRGLQEAE